MRIVACIRRAFLCACALAVLNACEDYPRDARGTLDRVEGGVLRVGISHHPPWICITIGNAGRMEVGGIEAALLKQWARQLDARIEWLTGTERDLVAALDSDLADVIAAGFDGDTAWGRRVALSRPYATVRLVLATSGGRDVAPERTGAEVTFHEGRLQVAAAIRQAGATPRPSSTPLSTLPAAVYDFELPAGAPHAAFDSGAEERRVFAVAAGENAFLLALDRFLHSNTRLDGGEACETGR